MDDSRRPRRSAGRAKWLPVALVLSAIMSAPVHGQQVRTVQIDDAAYTLLGRREGLPDGPLYWLSTGNDGQLLAGTSNGASRYVGGTFVRFPVIPERLRSTVRAVYDQRNGDRVFVDVFSVHIQRKSTFIAHAPVGEGRGTIFSALSMPFDEPSEQVIVGTSTGPYVLRASGQFASLPLPPTMERADAMVATRSVNGADELWVGTRGGGVARWRAGTWERFTPAEGLDDLRIEHIAMAPPGDSAIAIASTPSGAFVLVGKRWRAIGPRVNASRALRVLVGGRLETWIGTFGGELYRSIDDQHWRALDVPARGSRVQVLQAFTHGLDRPVVYAGFRSGILLRFRVGVAGRALLPTPLEGRPVTAVSQSASDGSFWTWHMGVGAVRFPDLLERRPTVRPSIEINGPVRLSLAPGGSALPLYVANDHLIDRFDADGGPRALTTPVASGIRDVQLLQIPEMGAQVVAFDLDQGWYSDVAGQLVPWVGFPNATRVLIEDRTTTPKRLLAVRHDRVFEYARGGWTSLAGSTVPAAGSVLTAASHRLASGECVLLLGMTEGIALHRTCGGASQWRVFADSTLPGLPSNEITGITVLAGDLVALGTSRGVVVVQFGPSFEDGLRIMRTFTAADGLPASSILAMGPVDRKGRLWVGTSLGAGFVDLSVLQIPIASPGTPELSITSGSDQRIGDGASLAATTTFLDLEAIATTNHRDDELRFRFELDGEAMHPTDWIERNSIRLTSLTPGQHVVAVQVHDYDGRRSLVATRTFTVLLPWWRRPAFLLLALFGTVGTALAWERARLAATRERARILEENEQRLAASELRFRRLFEGGTAPQLLLTEGRIRQANAALGTMLGVSADTLAGTDVELLLPGLASHLHAASVSAVWEGVLTFGDTLRIPVELHRTRIVLPDLVLEHLEVRDLREQRRLALERETLEVQLRDTQRLESVGTLAGGVAHDFNNLLTVIHTNAEMVAGDVTPESHSGQALQQLLLASTRAREVVRQILTFSRRATPRQAPVRVQTLLQETESLLRATIPTTVQLLIDNTATDAVVHGDETQLQQVLLNLSSNAEHAMRTTLGGTLRISAEWVEDAERPLQLSVGDTGVGIPDDVRSRMFEPFFTTKAVGEGTGLGLSVLYGIVQSHGGTVQVNSRIGEGTRVDIRLPASRATPLANTAAAPVYVAVGEPARILVVDDEEAVRTSVARVLTRRGFVVDTAGHGEEALAQIAASLAFDLVITDQTMPVMTGWEFVSRLRSVGNSIPVIIASGYGLSTDQSTLEQVPKVWRIDKPFSTDELVGLIHAILEQRA